MVGVVVGYLFLCHLMPGIWYYRPLPYAHIIDMARFITGDEVSEVAGAIEETFIKERDIIGGGETPPDKDNS